MREPGSEMGGIIRQLRHEHNNPFGDKAMGISQEQLAKKAGLGINIVHLYEIGRCKPWESLEKILDALGYELEVVRK